MSAVSGKISAVKLQDSAAQHSSLPKLRQELALLPGPHSADGSPTWMLHDPSANRYFRLGWLEFEVLKRWQLGSAEAIIDAFDENALFRPTLEDITSVSEFLMTHNLVLVRGIAALKRLNDISNKQKTRNFSWLLKNYLFLRMPLVRPDRFLNATIRYVAWMGSSTFALCTLACGLLGLVMISRQIDVFFSTIDYFFSIKGMLMVGLAIGFAKIIHELAHAYVSKYYGCRVPSMGIALLLLWPVLYTDATDSWKLRKRAERLRIGSAGMLAELYLAAYATLLWIFLPDGAIKSAVFLLATTTWVMTLFVNLNPLLRFDGYYLLSDFLRIPNLQSRAFELGRWHLREVLFGYEFPEPEFFPSRVKFAVLTYAYLTWIYRFFLFLAIAVIVYLFFFKALGIFLMIVELAWFIGRPIYSEIKEWAKRRHHLTMNRKSLRTFLVFSIFFTAIFYPWAKNINAPAYWRAEQHVRIYVPTTAQVQDVSVRIGDRVNTNQVLLAFSAPDLEHEIAQHARKIDILRWQSDFSSVSEQLQTRSTILYSELKAELATQEARNIELRQVQVRSPLNGEVVEILQPLSTGDWLPEGDWLMTVAALDSGMIEAWVQETDLLRLRLDQPARFYPASGMGAPFNLRIVKVDETATIDFSEPYVISLFGGPIPTNVAPDGRWVANESVYRVILRPEIELTSPSHITIGSVRLPVEPQSAITIAGRKILSIIIRESGF